MEITLSELRAWCSTKGRAVLVQPTGLREGAANEALRDITKETLCRQVFDDMGLDDQAPLPLAAFAMQAAGYESLAAVLQRAFNQAAHGKGKERHAQGEPFNQQVMQDMARRFGVGALLGQAFKKSEESQRLPHDRAVNELLGAIVYLAGAVIAMDAKAPKPANDNGLGAFIHERMGQPYGFKAHVHSNGSGGIPGTGTSHCKCGMKPASACSGKGCND